MAEPSEIAGTPQTDAERRRFRRIATRIEGRIVFAGVDAECLVHEMSATGAIVEVMPLPAIGTEVALDVPGVGFSRGTAKRHHARQPRLDRPRNLARPPRPPERPADPRRLPLSARAALV